MTNISPSKNIHKTPRWSTRAAAVFGAGFAFIAMTISGLVLVIAPRGSIANKIDWLFGGFDRHDWQAIHLTAGILFVVVAVWHILIHISVIKNLTFGTGASTQGHRSELLVMLTVVALFLTTAILNLPPASWLIDINEFFNRTYWAP